jgi:transposase
MLLAPTLDESIDKDNPVRIIDHLVEAMDLEKLRFVNAVPSTMGRPSYAAKDMLKLYIYGYQHGIRSSRLLEHELLRNLELKWLLKNLKPDHKTICEFRRKNPKPLQQVFREFVFMLDGWGLLGKNLFAVDGTKIKASNNKKQNFSKKKLKERIRRIDESISDYMKELDENDCGEVKVPAVSVKEVVEQLAKRREEYQGYLNTLEETGENEVSLADPDSRLMGNNRNGVDVSYNVQSAVDAEHHLVVEVNVTNKPSDHGQLGIMCKRLKKRLKLKGKVITVLADKGYYNEADIRRCQRHKIVAIVSRQKTGRAAPDQAYNNDKFIYNDKDDTCTCPQGAILKRMGTKSIKRYANNAACSTCLHRGKCTPHDQREINISHGQHVFEKADKLFAANKSLYKRWQMIVEHPFGTIKRTMNGGYFLLGRV